MKRKNLVYLIFITILIWTAIIFYVIFYLGLGRESNNKSYIQPAPNWPAPKDSSILITDTVIARNKNSMDR